MKAIYKVNENLSFEIEAETDSEMFRQIVHIEEVFSHTKDPNGNKAIFSMRTIDDTNFFEMVSSVDRRVKLQFVETRKEKQLFPRKFDDEKLKENKLERVKGSWLWTKYIGDK